MIRLTIFRKHFLLVMGVISFFLLWGLLVNNWLMRITMENRPPPPFNSARFLAAFANGDYVSALEKVEKNMEPGGSRLSLWDDKGHLLYPLHRDIKFPPFEGLLPQEVFEQRMLGEPPAYVLVRLPGEPAHYLLNEMKWRPHGPGWSPLIVLMITILMGAGSALFLIYRSFDGMVALADQVITELQNGNLKARFPIRRQDEIGKAMMRFNTMAEEIERLVEQVRQIERSRMTLLQDLAHDLRTPVASLRTLIETYATQREKLSTETQDEILRLAQAEVGYFEKLVEDLLFLARVGEPRYQVGRDWVDLSRLMTEEGHNAMSRSESSASKLSIEYRPAGHQNEKVLVQGDEQLLRRMIRNAIENAKSFAATKVLLRWGRGSDGRAEIWIEDDGPGFTGEVIESFGERRISRRLDATQEGRISLGLGSVIIKTVARAHGGEVKASNESSLGRGAQVLIRLPASVANSEDEIRS